MLHRVRQRASNSLFCAERVCTQRVFRDYLLKTATKREWQEWTETVTLQVGQVDNEQKSRLKALWRWEGREGPAHSGEFSLGLWLWVTPHLTLTLLFDMLWNIYHSHGNIKYAQCEMLSGTSVKLKKNSEFSHMCHILVDNNEAVDKVNQVQKRWVSQKCCSTRRDPRAAANTHTKRKVSTVHRQSHDSFAQGVPLLKWDVNSDAPLQKL